jgi:hypothetical protein
MKGKRDRRSQLEQYNAEFDALLQTSRKRAVKSADWAFVARGTPTHSGHKDAFASLCEAYARRGGTVANAIASAKVASDPHVRTVLKDAVDLSRLLHTHRIVPPKGHQWRGKLHGVVEVHKSQVMADLRGLGRGVDDATRAALERAMRLWNEDKTADSPTLMSTSKQQQCPFLQQSNAHWCRVLECVAVSEYEHGLDKGVQEADASLRLADAGVHPTRAYTEDDCVCVVAGPLKGIPEDHVEEVALPVQPKMTYPGTVRSACFQECLDSVTEVGCFDEIIDNVPFETAQARWIYHEVRTCVDELIHVVEMQTYEIDKSFLDRKRIGGSDQRHNVHEDLSDQRCTITKKRLDTCECPECGRARMESHELDTDDSSEDESGYEDSIADYLSFGEEEDLCEDTLTSTLTCPCIGCTTARFNRRSRHEEQRETYQMVRSDHPLPHPPNPRHYPHPTPGQNPHPPNPWHDPNPTPGMTQTQPLA